MEKNKVGRPPRFNNPEELQEKFEEYLTSKEDIYKFKNISGFCWFAGTHRDHLSRISEEKPEFLDTVKGIRDYLANYTLGNADVKEKNQALNIFLLKNYGYTDKTEQDVNIKGNISIEQLFNNLDHDKENK